MFYFYPYGIGITRIELFSVQYVPIIFFSSKGKDSAFVICSPEKK